MANETDLYRAIAKKTRPQERGVKTREAKEKSDRIQFERAVGHLRDLVVGKMATSVKQNKFKSLNGGDTALKVIKLLKHGVTPEAILLHVPQLPQRFDWKDPETKEMLYAAGKGAKVDPNLVARVFDLEEPGTVVVSAE